MNTQVSTSLKGSGATVVSKVSAPPPLKSETARDSRAKEGPAPLGTGPSFFVGRDDVFIICSNLESSLVRMYGDPKAIHDKVAEVGPLTILSLNVDESSGIIRHLTFRLRQKGSRLYEVVEFLSAGALVGAHLSVQVRREDEPEEIKQ